MATKIVAVRITHTYDLHEYVVLAYRRYASGGTERYADADYFTSDKTDAQATAKAMLGVISDLAPRIGKVYSAADFGKGGR